MERTGTVFDFPELFCNRCHYLEYRNTVGNILFIGFLV